MRTILRRDLTKAIKARDLVAVSALRSALAAIENAEAPAAMRVQPSTAESEHVAGSVAGLVAAEVERLYLTGPNLCAIVETEVHERLVAAREYEQTGRTDAAQRLRSEAAVLSCYLEPSR